MKSKTSLAKSRSVARGGQTGFTLLELLIIIAIMGILAGVIVPNAANMLNTSSLNAANTELANIEMASLAYFAERGYWPPDSDSLDTLITGRPKAKYSFDSATGLVIAVSSVRWSGISFSPPPEPYARNGEWVK